VAFALGGLAAAMALIAAAGLADARFCRGFRAGATP
jgi:hypothetical protein